MPKAGGQTRFVFHLSWPEKNSIDYHTPKEKCTVKYKDLDHAVHLLMQEGKGCFMTKSDMKSAFRNLPIRPQDWGWLVMMCKHPRNGKKYYFIDKALPFGSSFSCCHFQRFSDDVEAILRHRTQKKSNNYLDDFLMIAMLQSMCDWIVEQFLDICKQINFPIALEKMEWSTTIITFLGMLLDTVNQIIAVPIEKRDKALKLLNQMHNRKGNCLTNPAIGRFAIIPKSCNISGT